MIRPFLKWAGGKRQLIPEIRKYIPEMGGVYYEPFVGAGALLFSLQPTQALINDSNSELINCYEVIRNSVGDLIEALKVHEQAHCENHFYEIREWDRLDNYDTRNRIERAARIIYLNKTCFNGLFRVNSQKQFNVPFGQYKKPNIVEADLLRDISQYLNSSEIKMLNGDFQVAVQSAKIEDFIYFDPPYDPLSTTASFTGYAANGFDRSEQERLKMVVDDLSDRGCKVLLSNAYTEFILDLYKEYKQEKVEAARAINSNAVKRGKIAEILIRNYA
jgi:DNA adenine methylase